MGGVCIPQKSFAIARNFWNIHSLGWTPFRIGAHNGLCMSSNSVHTSVMITRESFNFERLWIKSQITASKSFDFGIFFSFRHVSSKYIKCFYSVVWHKFRFRQNSTIWIAFGVNGITAKTKLALQGLFKFGMQIGSGSALNWLACSRSWVKCQYHRLVVV